jgi:hypothetical protein
MCYEVRTTMPFQLAIPFYRTLFADSEFAKHEHGILFSAILGTSALTYERSTLQQKSSLSRFAPAVITCAVEEDPFQRWL